MHYTENEETFWKYHSMGCGYCGEFERKRGYPEDPIIYVCPKCGSEYRPEQEHQGEIWSFAGDSVDMFSRVSDEELIEELPARGYQAVKRPTEFLKKGKEKTFGELFRERYLKIKEIGFEIERTHISMRYDNLSEGDYTKAVEKVKGLEKQRDELLLEP